MSNIVFIATSLDGYIADKNGGLDWLHAIPNPEGNDMGFSEHFARIDALVMGRNTLDMVLSFDIEWPYSKPVFVLSNSMSEVPTGYEGKVFLLNGPLDEVLAHIHKKGFNKLYIDGGVTIQNFLKEDLIDEMIITTIPVLLGGGASLFGELEAPLDFKCVKSTRFLDTIVQNHFIRSR
ncbi:dihydrofolate reductase family protein [Vibrio sp. ZSDZ34]|jgi:dihydrofolate reductase|uniref:Dihydrofolate reductase family protein n=1 Tax=Vibrio gelatinilyticus TaxID=2893468 RepID=A0A9X1WHZ1_9VIBR|nr:dihydrofolate reductase family protein [Vibrio gelatinilyticus]MCJ2376964.1 dihydrofolate reductase family protein [Vibrio gelatinilyticus]